MLKSGQKSEKDFKKNVQIIAELSNKGARIAYWNMQNKRYIDNKQFKFLDQLSKNLFTENQSWFYRDFCIYEKVHKWARSRAYSMTFAPYIQNV